MTRTDKKITLCNIRFNLHACTSLSAEQVDALSDTARNFFSIFSSFWQQAT